MRKICLLLFFCCAVTTSVSAQAKWPSTFLWRISGNGLTAPSYLYGTIHVKDKSAFWLGDSIYYHLENTQGLALEINPDETLGPQFRQMFDAMDLLNNEEENEQPRATLYEPKPEKDSPKKTKRNLPGYRIYEPPGAVKKGEQMNVIIDGYLFYLAKEKGKWLGGLEDPADHFKFINELGKNINPDATGLEEKETVYEDTRSQLIQWYKTKNLEKINGFYNIYLSSNDPFIQRNQAMAKRADSLSRVRTMFYAVGVGHLPGDSGVINLLRQRGFTLTPVFSGKDLPPVIISDHFEQWKSIWPADSSYTYRVPVQPVIGSPKGINMKVALSYDIPKRFIYFFSAISYPKRKPDSDSFKILKEMVNEQENGGTKYTHVKWFRYKGFPAVSAITTEDGISFPTQIVLNNNVVYMMLCGSDEAGINADNCAQHFFNSLNILGQPREEVQEWVTHTDSAMGFAITCPCTFSPLRLNRNESDSTASYRNSECIDLVTGTRYYIGVNRNEPGYFNNSDTAFFNNYKKELGSSASSSNEVNMETGVTGGYPSARYRFLGTDDYYYDILSVIKGNYRYHLMAYTAGKYTDGTNTPGNRFIESLKLLSFPEQPLQKVIHPDGDLYALIPGSFSCTPVTGEQPLPGMRSFTDCQVYDSATATTVSFFKSTYNRYKWFSNDSAWLDAVTGISRQYGDSLLSKKLWYHNGLPVADLEFAINMQYATRRHRYMVNGPVLYEVNTVLTRNQWQSPRWQTIFDSIVLLNPKPLNLFTPKTTEIMDGLVSADSLTYEQAKQALNDVPFTAEDLPNIYNASLRPVPLDTLEGFSKAGRNLLDAMANLAKPESIDSFVLANYYTLPANAAIKKADLLYLLANNQTTGSTALLKKLLLNHTPKEFGYYNIGYRITDSLELAEQLFPEMATLLNDSIYRYSTIVLMGQLAVSGRISLPLIAANETAINKFAAGELKLAQQNKEYYDASINETLTLLARLKTPGSLKILNGFQKLTDPILLFTTLKTPVRYQLPVQPAMLQKLAASLYYRNDTYIKLKENKLEKQFPALYATQKAMAESYLGNYSSSDLEFEPDKLFFIKEFTNSYKGKLHRFFVFRLRYKDEDEQYEHTGIAGPFAIDTKKLLPVNGYSGIWINLDEPYSPKGVPEQVKKYLEMLKENE